MSFKKLLIPSICLLTFSLSGCESLNSGLNAINESVSSLGSVFGSDTSTTSNSMRIPEALTASIQNAIQKSIAYEKADMQNMVTDASPRIAEVTGKLACGVEYTTLGRYATPQSKPHPYVRPSRDMNYHTGGCVDVLRIHSWKKLAANSLSFSIDYISPSSEEVVKKNYIIVKQDDGEWLYNWNTI